jgi:hypothetical protein
MIALAFGLLFKSANLNAAQHFFFAQREVLQEAVSATAIVSLFLYLVIGVQISRYMTSMILVFTRAIEEESFPVRLRYNDTYHSLANTINRAYEKIR